MEQTEISDDAEVREPVESPAEVFDMIERFVDWEGFRPELERLWRSPKRPPSVAQSPWDSVLVFKMLFLTSLYGLADGRAWELVSDRLLFRRFLGLGVTDPVPDARTLQAHRRILVKAGRWSEMLASIQARFGEQGWKLLPGKYVLPELRSLPK